MKKLIKVSGDRMLYQHTGSKMFYIRICTDGRDTYQSLETTRKAIATDLRNAYERKQSEAKLGVEPAKEKLPRLKITDALSTYEEAEFASIRRGKMRKPGEKHSRTEADAVPRLDEFFEGKYVDELAPALLDKYHAWRKKNVKAGSDGARTTDLELNTLSKALDWNVRQEKLIVNPISKRDRYYSPSEARKTKEVACSSTEEVHTVAGLLFEDKRSEVIGWQFLWENFFGMRTGETLALRRDAKDTEQPGFIQGDSMYVRRAEKNADNPCIYLHPDGQVLLAAMDAWSKKRYPDTPWYFPGGRGSSDHVGEGVLTQRLELMFKDGRLTKKLTSHGGRGFYVLVNRSNGVHDSQTAAELNQVGGLETLRESYGVIPQHWLHGKGPKLKWLPAEKEDYAWAKLFTKLGLKVGDEVPAPSV